MTLRAEIWPYLPTLTRLALAVAIGLFVGIERERRQKEAGLRTFAFASLLGAVGGLLGDAFALVAMGLVGVLVVFLNVETIRTGEGAEITTSAALIVTAFAGLLAGQGHAFTPTALGITTAALLTWKRPLAGFSQTLTESELRSAILLAILAFVIYPILPAGSVDPWHLVEPRAAWVTVLMIAALGFANYILLKLYGQRGIYFTAFLGGLVNSTVTVAELATVARATDGRLRSAAYRGVLLATAAMLLRNGIILGLLAPVVLLYAGLPLLLMFAATVAAAALPGATDSSGTSAQDIPGLHTMESPFSLTAALRFGVIFLAIEVAGSLAQRAIGQAGFYAVSVVGGLVSSASTVASAATLSASGMLIAQTGAVGAVLASLMSAAVNLPIIARVSRDRQLSGRLMWVLGAVGALGVIGMVLLREFPMLSPTAIPAGILGLDHPDLP